MTVSLNQIRELAEKNYAEWWESQFGDINFSGWDSYRIWLLTEGVVLWRSSAQSE